MQILLVYLFFNSERELVAKNILIIDDNQEILLLLKKILEDPKYIITTFTSSKEALSYIMENASRIDLILIDIVMPDIDGMELIDELKRKDDIKTIPHIFISAKNEEFLKKLTAYDPNSIFIQKPIDKNELIDKMNTILN